jgi:mRNA interferase RelE/StbE
MSYELFIMKRAQRELSALARADYVRVREAIRSLGDDPRSRDAKKLKGREGWRIRVGNYRVIYEINDAKETVIVLHVGHRRSVYEVH